MYRLSLLMCVVLLLRCTPALAQTEIHHCIGAGGGAVFTDQPCAALNATAVSPDARANDGTPLPAPPPILCAADMDDLRQSVIDAFARHDANRLAGLMLWDGYGQRAAISDIRSLSQLVRQPLLGMDMPGQSDDSSTAPAASSSADINPPFQEDIRSAPAAESRKLVLHLADDSVNDRRFDVVTRAGCLWLRNVD